MCGETTAVSVVPVPEATYSAHSKMRIVGKASVLISAIFYLMHVTFYIKPLQDLFRSHFSNQCPHEIFGFHEGVDVSHWGEDHIISLKI